MTDPDGDIDRDPDPDRNSGSNSGSNSGASSDRNSRANSGSNSDANSGGGRKPRPPMSDARVSGMVATVVLILLTAFVGWFIWLAG